MRHELRTPLNAILGYSEMLQEDAGEAGQDQVVADLQKIQSSGKHLLTLINDVLDLSKLEAGRMEAFAETFDVAALVEEVAATAKPLAERNGNRIDVRYGSHLGEAHSDLMKTRQVLLNLTSNACKFSENGVVAIGVSREGSTQGDAIIYTVSDTGIGMTPEQLSSLFQSFKQADSSTTRKYGGAGLGLAISQGFSHIMGGEVSVVSTYGSGATFTLRVPAVIPAATGCTTPPRGLRPAVIPTLVASPARPAPLSHVTTVLVIDDNQDTRDLLSTFLKREGIRSVGCPHAREGLELARTIRPDAITLDVRMEGFNGWDALSALKADPELCDIPVIMVTVDDDRKRTFSLGAADFLMKPVDAGALARSLSQYRKGFATRGHVLVVEDDATSREMTKTMLEKAGYTVSEAENGARGLERLRDRPVDVILLDLMMPEMDGFEFARQTAADPSLRAIPIVVLTAIDMTPDDRRRLDVKMSRILQKGDADARTVLARVAGALRTRVGAETGGDVELKSA